MVEVKLNKWVKVKPYYKLRFVKYNTNTYAIERSVYMNTYSMSEKTWVTNYDYDGNYLRLWKTLNGVKKALNKMIAER